MVKNKENDTSICSLLIRLVKTHQRDHTLCFGELIKTFGDQGYGLLAILFALPSALPISIIPGFSLVSGALIVFIAIHIILAKPLLWIPKKLAERQFSYTAFLGVVEKSIPYLRKLEHWLKPRWFFFSHPLMERAHGVMMLLLSGLLLLPIPLSNFIFASLIILFGLGLSEKDGVILCMAYVGSCLYVLFLVFTVRGLARYLLG